jgi:hypothetical protein
MTSENEIRMRQEILDRIMDDEPGEKGTTDLLELGSVYRISGQACLCVFKQRMQTTRNGVEVQFVNIEANKVFGTEVVYLTQGKLKTRGIFYQKLARNLLEWAEGEKHRRTNGQGKSAGTAGS